ncbi:hypothetical protein LINPERHAP1_LOCUS4528, partial [Linum perenne]
SISPSLISIRESSINHRRDISISRLLCSPNRILNPNFCLGGSTSRRGFGNPCALLILLREDGHLLQML